MAARRDALYAQQIFQHYQSAMAGRSGYYGGCGSCGDSSYGSMEARQNWSWPWEKEPSSSEVQAQATRAQAETQRLIQASLQSLATQLLPDGTVITPSGFIVAEPTPSEKVSEFLFSVPGAITCASLAIGGYFAYRHWSTR